MKKIDVSLTIPLVSNFPYIDATLDEEDSYWFLRTWQVEFSSFHKYSSDIHSMDLVLALANNFIAFHSKIVIPGNLFFFSTAPLTVFRYIMKEDLESWDYYTLTKKRSGYVVEGAQWTNGLVYQVRTHNSENFDILQLNFFLDKETKVLDKYPDLPILSQDNETQPFS